MIRNRGTWEDVLDYERDKLKMDAALTLERELHLVPKGFESKEVMHRGIDGDRKWRFDLTLPHGVVVEIEGGTGKNRKRPSRHLTPKGFNEDCVKYGEAAAMGWCVIRVTPRMIYDDTMVRLVKAALQRRGWEA